jgi:hypothetical protein
MASLSDMRSSATQEAFGSSQADRQLMPSFPDRKRGPTVNQIFALIEKLRQLNPDPAATCWMVYRINDLRFDCDVISYDADEKPLLLGSISVDATGTAKLKI